MSGGSGKGIGENWSEYQRLVLSEIKRLSTEVRAVNEKVTKVQIEIAMLKVKSSLWGAASGLLSFMIANFLKGH